jgi:hypothetical protein
MNNGQKHSFWNRFQTRKMKNDQQRAYYANKNASRNQAKRESAKKERNRQHKLDEIGYKLTSLNHLRMLGKNDDFKRSYVNNLITHKKSSNEHKKHMEEQHMLMKKLKSNNKQKVEEFLSTQSPSAMRTLKLFSPKTLNGSIDYSAFLQQLRHTFPGNAAKLRGGSRRRKRKKTQKKTRKRSSHK